MSIQTPWSLPPIPSLKQAELAKRRINSRDKGKRGERQVVVLLQAVVDRVLAKLERPPMVLQRNALQAHLGGCDLHGLDGFAVEVKFCENEQLPAWWRQAVSQADKLNAVPVLFYRAKNKPWKVRFRAYVATPRDREWIEMDLDVSLEDFLTWFEDAFTERHT